MYSDQDIIKAIEDWRNNRDTGLNIEDFDETKCLTPVGYDFRVGKEGFSWKKKCVVNIEKDGIIWIEPDDTVVIRTLESLTLSKEISATVHSMVSKIVTKGLSDISTTIDPGWLGTLLITIHNNRDTRAFLEFKATFCTVCFYKLDNASKVNRGTPANRDDLWERLLEIARDEEKRIEDEKKKIELQRQQESQKIDRENQKRTLILVISVIVLVLVIGIIFVEFSDKNVAMAVATCYSTFLAVIFPAVYDRFLKQIPKP